MSSRKTHGFFRDEQGDKSLARVCCAITLGFTLGIVLGSWAFEKPLDGEVVGMLTAINGGLIGWAGAPRVARYFKRERREPAMNARPSDL